MTDWGNLYSLDSQRHRNHLQKKQKKPVAVESEGKRSQETPFTTITQNRSCGWKKTVRVSDR